MDWQFASGCSPPRLSTTQLPPATDSQCSVRRGLSPLSWCALSGALRRAVGAGRWRRAQAGLGGKKNSPGADGRGIGVVEDRVKEILIAGGAAGHRGRGAERFAIRQLAGEGRAAGSGQFGRPVFEEALGLACPADIRASAFRTCSFFRHARHRTAIE